METIATAPAPALKTGELCQSILDRPDFAEMRRRIDAFMNDELAKFQYQMLNDRGAMLQQKQAMGAQITDEEIAQFEALREGFMKNTVATEFIDAQQELQKVLDSVTQRIHKTFELGRLPTEEDFASSCCDSGCGCH
jgi:cell fate (sporulation/competence/biofilm development) regulator YlbF (YheA/YmcA/DUF963 family)